MQICEINLEDQEEKYESEVTSLSIIATFYEFFLWINDNLFLSATLLAEQ